MDCFIVLTLNFGILYCFFAISYDRLCILNCNVTKHPTCAWVKQQLSETFPYEAAK
jgi:hypothetical protein